MSTQGILDLLPPAEPAPGEPNPAPDQLACLRLIHAAGARGLTSFELQTPLAERGMVRDRNCISKRCGELEALKLVVGHPSDRGKNRRPATAYSVTEAGREVAGR